MACGRISVVFSRKHCFDDAQYQSITEERYKVSIITGRGFQTTGQWKLSQPPQRTKKYKESNAC